MPPYDDYLKLASEWEAEFARNKRLYGDKIHCRKGCTDCCSQLFQITEVEAAYVSRGIRALPPDQQKRIKQQAGEYLRARQKLLAEKDVPDAWGSLPPPGLRLPCPALEDGACQIYPHRPLICRRYGIPLYNAKKPDQIFACELNFGPGEEIEATELIQIQTGIQNRWADLQAEYNRRGGRRDPKPLTVARAILEDFEPCLPKA